MMVKLTPPATGTHEPPARTDLQIETLTVGVQRAALTTHGKKALALHMQRIVEELNLDAA